MSDNRYAHLHWRIGPLIEQLTRRYNPENDVIPDAPWVTITDYQLLEIAVELSDKLAETMKDLEMQKGRILQLEQNIATIKRIMVENGL